MKVVATVLSALFLPIAAFATLTPDQVKQLPPPATHKIDFKNEVKPIFESSCTRCHGRGRTKGGLQLDTRETLMKGGDSGAAIVPGKSQDSYLIALVAGVDPDSVMPKKGKKLTKEEVGVLRAWIDQGAVWDAEITFGKIPPKNMAPRMPEIPAGKAANPIDRFLTPYYASHKIKPEKPVSDRLRPSRLPRHRRPIALSKRFRSIHRRQTFRQTRATRKTFTQRRRQLRPELADILERPSPQRLQRHRLHRRRPRTNYQVALFRIAD